MPELDLSVGNRDSGEAAKEEGRSQRKHRAILEAATEVFLRSGYLGANMDEIASLSSVSKQTIYKHFVSKEALFIAVVTAMTDGAGDLVHNRMADASDGAQVETYLRDYAYLQLSIVLTPRIMQLRRLVIAEVPRFPELARVLYERGPGRALGQIGAALKQLADRGLLSIDDPAMAASHFNWLVMSEPLNAAMLLGDEAIPATPELRRHADAGVRVFLAAYGAAKPSAG